MSFRTLTTNSERGQSQETAVGLTGSGSLPDYRNAELESNHNLENLQDLKKFSKQVYSSNPELSRILTPEQFTKITEEIYQNLDPGLKQHQKLSMLKELLTLRQQTGSAGLEDLRNGANGEGQLIIANLYDGRSLIQNLHDLATKPLHESIRHEHSNYQFLTSLLRDLVDRNEKDVVSQGLKNTCAVTTAQWHDIGENSAVYAAQISEMLIDGRFTNGANKTVLELPPVIPGDSRTLTSRVYQTALMSLADSGYNANTDMVEGKTGSHHGLFARQLWQIRTETTGNPHRVAYLEDQGRDGQGYTDIIDKALSNRHSMIAVVKGIGSGPHIWHDVNVVDRKDGYVYFRNPWPETYIQNGNGIEEVPGMPHICRMDEKQFLSQTQYMVYETDDQSDLNFCDSKVTGSGLWRDEIGGFQSNNEPVAARFFTIEPLEEDIGYFLKKLREKLEEQFKKIEVKFAQLFSASEEKEKTATAHKEQSETDMALSRWAQRLKSLTDNN